MIIIIILFTIYYIIRGRFMCPCPNPSEKMACYRTEIWGLQINHLIFYTIIGFLYPHQFITWQLLGFIWELLEFIPTLHPKILNYIGGCIQKNKINHFTVNPVDQWLPRDKKHFWHPKLSDIILNLIGFYLGYYFSTYK